MNVHSPRVPLGEVLRLSLCPEDVSPERSYPTFGVYGFGRGLFNKPPVVGAEISATKLFRARAGQFVYSRLKAFEGAFGLVPEEFDCRCVTNEFPTFDCLPDRLVPAYLDLYFRRPAAWVEAAQLSTGIGARRERLHPEEFLSLAIPLPPLSEQRRIVARVEAITSRIEEARRLRKEAATEAEVIVQTARSHEFRNLPSANQPVPLGQATQTRLGKMLSTATKLGIAPAPYLRNANIQNDRIDLSSIYEMDFLGDEREEFCLQPGDILINEGGYGVGRCAVWEGQIDPCYFQKSLHRVRVDPDRIIPRFMMHQLIWAADEGQFDDITKATTFQHLTGVRLKRHTVFIPPVAEQRRVVAHLDAVRAKANALRALQSETAAELDALLPSVLAKAFAGEL